MTQVRDFLADFYEFLFVAGVVVMLIGVVIESWRK
jgi:hypothetical protein